MKKQAITAAAILGVLCLFAFFYQSAAYSSRTGTDTPLYSVHRLDPYGTAAFYELLAKNGTSVRLLERPELEPTDRGVLVQVLADREASASDFHIPSTRLIDWISQGNTVIQLTRSKTDLLQSVNRSATPAPPATAPSIVSTTDSTLEEYEKLGGAPDDAPATHRAVTTTLPGSPRLLLWSPVVFEFPVNSSWHALARLSDKSNGVVAAELNIGRGRLVVVGAPTPALNATIATEGNLDFLLGLIGRSPVIIDEWSHGIGHERTVISFLRDVGLLPALFQIAVVAGLYVWSTSGHAAPGEVIEIRQRSSVEQIETLGFLYSRSLDRVEKFKRVHQEVDRRFAAALRCQPPTLTANLAALTPDLQFRIQQLLIKLDTLRIAPPLGCASCGYDLSFSKSKRCPECGAPISAELQARIANAAADVQESPARSTKPSAPPTTRRHRIDLAFAAVLNDSHQLTLEVIRERRSRR